MPTHVETRWLKDHTYGVKMRSQEAKSLDQLGQLQVLSHFLVEAGMLHEHKDTVQTVSENHPLYGSKSHYIEIKSPHSGQPRMRISGMAGEFGPLEYEMYKVKNKTNEVPLALILGQELRSITQLNDYLSTFGLGQLSRYVNRETGECFLVAEESWYDEHPVMLDTNTLLVGLKFILRPDVSGNHRGQIDFIFMPAQIQ